MGIFWEFFGNFLGILWEFFGNSLQMGKVDKNWMTAEILWNSSMILRLNGRQGQGKRSLEARADAFSRLKNSSRRNLYRNI